MPFRPKIGRSFSRTESNRSKRTEKDPIRQGPSYISLENFKLPCNFTTSAESPIPNPFSAEYSQRGRHAPIGCDRRGRNTFLNRK